jgi:hypothetical protein
VFSVRDGLRLKKRLSLDHNVQHSIASWQHCERWTRGLLRQPMYLYPDIEARSCNHCYSGKAIHITFSECVSVALGIQHAMHMHYIVICGLSGSTICFHIISQTARFPKKKNMNTKRVFWFSLQFQSATFLILRRSERDVIKNLYRSPVKYPIFLSDFNGTCIFLTDFYKKYWNVKLHVNPTSVSRADRRTDMTNQIVAFRNFANAPKNGWWRRPWSRAWMLWPPVKWRPRSHYSSIFKLLNVLPSSGTGGKTSSGT